MGVPVDSGEMNKRVTIQRPLRREDGYGEETGGWEEIATVWASIHPLSANEKMRALSVQLETTHKITLRFDKRITADCRLVLQGTNRAFNILSITDEHEAHRKLVISAVEVSK